MTPRTIVLTGASDGIGAAAARRLAERGERLLLVGRSSEKLAAVAGPLGAESFVADFTHLDEVRVLAAWVRERTDRIDVLANNAGGIFAERRITADGHEATMQVNHDAHFLLTHLLMDALRVGQGTVINTSSIASRAFGRIDLADLDNREYSATKAYGDAKLANILFAKGLHARAHDQGISAVAFHPGYIASNFAGEGRTWMRFLYRTPLRRLMGSSDVGAGRLLWFIDGVPDATWTSGEYYEGRRPPRKPNPQQADEALIDAFWAESERRVGISS
ncbi:MAG: SDR family NAD(P)-dependent oxidoreductase [Actinomycetota bacterium]